MIPAFLAALSPRTRRLAYYGLVILLIGSAALLIAKCAQDWVEDGKEQAVHIDRLDAVTEATNRVLAADREASANQMERDQIAADNDKELVREVSKGDGRDVGPGTAAVLERMRRQQAAGRRGSPAP